MWKLAWCVLLMVACHHSKCWGLRPPFITDSIGGEGPPLDNLRPCLHTKDPKVEAVKNRIDSSDDEKNSFYVEHEISERDARKAVKVAEVDSDMISAGCACGHKEMDYCAGEKVINDHCCCDRSDHELFPYVPHTCYFGNDRCNLIAESCEEYEFLRDCCCSKHLIAKWKARFSRSPGNQKFPTKWLWILPWIVMIVANMT
ncbi:uncharacterized protein LOC143918795 [Arctopsyche grandis]|uniref:uncharacterized protein LOC143918795 n=1 Tax=Arctopsyche grandis TaxID=121162 RepID=UPI00406D7F5A